MSTSDDETTITTLGITGGIASGKSTVVQMLAEMGAATVSADAIARALTRAGAPLALAILQEFGSHYADLAEAGAIDRAKLARLIFSDADARRRLEAITHPAIIAEQEAQIEVLKAQAAHPLIAVEIPLLFEADLVSRVDKTLVARCSRRAQLARLAEREPTLTRAERALRVDSQMPLDQKAARADFVIETEQPLSDVRRQVRQVFDKLTAGKV